MTREQQIAARLRRVLGTLKLPGVRWMVGAARYDGVVAEAERELAKVSSETRKWSERPPKGRKP